MTRITIIRSETSPFIKKGDTFYGDIQQIRLLLVDNKLDIDYRTLYEHNLASLEIQRLERIAVSFHKSLKPVNIKWKPVELEKYNQKLREELDASELIVCQDELIKEFISSILNTEKTIVAVRK